MLDFNAQLRQQYLRVLRVWALVGAVLCLVGLIANLYDVDWPADVVLAFGAVVFFVHCLNYSADLHELTLVDDKNLHKKKPAPTSDRKSDRQAM